MMHTPGPRWRQCSCSVSGVSFGPDVHCHRGGVNRPGVVPRHLAQITIGERGNDGDRRNQAEQQSGILDGVRRHEWHKLLRARLLLLTGADARVVRARLGGVLGEHLERVSTQTLDGAARTRSIASSQIHLRSFRLDTSPLILSCFLLSELALLPIAAHATVRRGVA